MLKFEVSDRAMGEARRGFENRINNGFWDAYLKDGLLIDIGYKGGDQNAEPLFKNAIGIDFDTPGYNGRDLPFENDSIATIHASHLLEHIADYGYFFRESIRVLKSGGTLILTVPLMQAYENRLTPLSIFNPDHKRFYTSHRLCYELETSLPRNSYRIIHLRELFNMNDLSRNTNSHAVGPFYEIECVVQKTEAGAIYA